MARFRKYMSAEKLARPFPQNSLNKILAFARGDETMREAAICSANITSLLYPNYRQHPAILFMAAAAAGQDVDGIAAARAAVLALEA